jgi:hypothetical protein
MTVFQVRANSRIAMATHDVVVDSRRIFGGGLFSLRGFRLEPTRRAFRLNLICPGCMPDERALRIIH